MLCPLQLSSLCTTLLCFANRLVLKASCLLPDPAIYYLPNAANCNAWSADVSDMTCTLQDARKHVMPGEPAIWISFPSATICDRWLTQINDIRRWPCVSLQSALTGAEASVQCWSDDESLEDSASSDNSTDSSGHSEQQSDIG